MLLFQVAILRTCPETVLADYHRLLNLAGYQAVVGKDADTALKVNISWHFFFPGSSTTPWQLKGIIRAMKRDGYDPRLIHVCTTAPSPSMRIWESAVPGEHVPFCAWTRP